MSSVIETRRTADSLDISIPIEGLSNEQIGRLIDLIKAETIVAKSELTQADADKIARDVNRSWWIKNRSRIEKMIGEHG